MLTQTQYVTSNKLAQRDIRHKPMTKAKIESHKNTTSKSAQSGRCNLK
jgi:hypothetical protein